MSLKTEDDFNAIINNNKLPCNVRYAMLRQAICEQAKTPEDRKTLLEMVGHELGGELVKGHPNYWTFKDGKKAKFELSDEPKRPVSAMARAFMAALQKP